RAAASAAVEGHRARPDLPLVPRPIPGSGAGGLRDALRAGRAGPPRPLPERRGERAGLPARHARAALRSVHARDPALRPPLAALIRELGVAPARNRSKYRLQRSLKLSNPV